MPTQQVISVGTTSGDGTGDPMPIAGSKINANFTELWDAAFVELPAAIQGASVPDATAAVLGKVILDQDSAGAKVVTQKTLTGANGLGAIFRPIAGKTYLRNSATGLYHELIVSPVVGIPALGINSVGLTFASLPPA